MHDYKKKMGEEYNAHSQWPADLIYVTLGLPTWGCDNHSVTYSIYLQYRASCAKRAFELKIAGKLDADADTWQKLVDFAMEHPYFHWMPAGRVMRDPNRSLEDDTSIIRAVNEMLTDVMSKVRKSHREICTEFHGLGWYWDTRQGIPNPDDGSGLPHDPGNKETGEIGMYYLLHCSDNC